MVIGKYSKLMNWIVRIIVVLISISLCFMTIITVVEVIRRYLFGLVFPWSEELVRFLLVWITFLGGSVAFRKGELVVMDMLAKYIKGKKSEIVVKVFVNTVCIGLAVFMFIKSYQILFSTSVASQFATGLNIPMIVPYAVIPLGFALIILFGIEHYIRIGIKGLDSGEEN